MAQNKKYKKKNYKKKKKSTGKPLQIYRQSKINYPLMPETRLARVNYTTRIQYEKNSAPAVRFDDVMEKKQVHYKKTQMKAGMYYMTKYWSLKKDPLYKTELTPSNNAGSDVGWGASFGQDVNEYNRRYLHLCAAPLITKDDTDPSKIDVTVEIEQVILLSNLRDVAQSH